VRKQLYPPFARHGFQQGQQPGDECLRVERLPSHRQPRALLAQRLLPALGRSRWEIAVAQQAGQRLKGCGAVAAQLAPADAQRVRHLWLGAPFHVEVKEDGVRPAFYGAHRHAVARVEGLDGVEQDAAQLLAARACSGGLR